MNHHRRTLVLIGLAIFTVLTVSFFQNCSKMNFSQSSLNAGSNQDINATPDSNNPDNSEIPKTSDPVCAEDQYANGAHQCVEFECNRYVEITTDNVSIPARSISGSANGGICYYKKLFNAITNGPSYLGWRRDTVLANDHDRSGFDNHPYTMGVSDFNLTLQGKRSVKLSSKPDRLVNTIVDNFLLVRFNYDEKLFAYGSSYAAMYGKNYIIYDGRAVNMNSTFSSGVSFSVKPLDFAAQFPINKRVPLVIEALDCGRNRELSNVYMIFQ